MSKLIAAVVFLPVALFASTVDCGTGIDASTLTGPSTLTLGNETYSNFRLGHSADYTQATICIDSSSAAHSGYDELDLSFVLNPDPQPDLATWFFVTFHVEDNLGPFLSGLEVDNIDGNNVNVYEMACDGVIAGNACNGNDLGHLVGLTGVPASLSFAYDVQSMDVTKWFDANDSTISHLDNGVTESPEPIMSVLIGSGLLLASILQRKRKEDKAGD